METPLQLPQAILDAARMLLVEEGVAGLSMRKVAARIGYSATAIYLHFPSKDALLHALLDEGMEMLERTLVDALADAPPDPEARLRALSRAYLAFGVDQPARYEVMFLLHPRHMERYPVEKFRVARRNLDLFAVTLEGIGVTGAGARLAASAAWAQLHGVASLRHAGRFDVRLNADAVAEAVVDAVVAGALALAPTA